MTKIITLCGSTKFKDEFIELNKFLTLDGFIVLSCGYFAHSEPFPLSEELKQKVDELHYKKILLSDLILVINKEGYIGDSTKKEIRYAEKQNKGIIYAYRIDEPFKYGLFVASLMDKFYELNGKFTGVE